MPPPGDLPHPGIEPESQVFCLADKFFTTSATWKALSSCKKAFDKIQHSLVIKQTNKKISQQIKY